jgi:hypothetical protein
MSFEQKVTDIYLKKSAANLQCDISHKLALGVP